MSDIFEMQEEGILCMGCGVYLDDSKGDFPQYCDDCEGDDFEHTTTGEDK